MTVAGRIDEPLHGGNGFRGSFAMQVKPAAGDVFSSLQPPELAPVHAWRHEGIVCMRF
jgi:hypothetical protein